MGIKTPIYTVHYDCNSGLIKKATQLYIKQGDTIADVTYGKGVFWKEIDHEKYNIVGTDMKTGVDFRNLNYKDKSFNHSVIDPPYARISNLKGMVSCYNTSRFRTHEDIIEGLYAKDLFILVNTKNPKVIHKQQHARKTHSYLWVFQC